MEMFSCLPVEFQYTCLTSLLMCRNQEFFLNCLFQFAIILFTTLTAVIFLCANVK